MKAKKLLFFTKMNFGVSANGGIKKKVFAQVKAFKLLGLNTEILFIENNKIIIDNKNSSFIKSTSNKIQFLIYLYWGFLNQIDIKSYDYIYVRHFLTNPFFLVLLWKIKSSNKKIKIFMEIPTFPYRFEFIGMSFLKRAGLFLDQICSRFFKYFIDRIVTFSSNEYIFNIKTLKSDNGIDIDTFGLVEPANFDGNELHLLGLANVQTWHGFDRIIKGIIGFKKTKDNLKIIFHVVGQGDEIENLRQLVSVNNLKENVKFHGFLNGQELDNMFKTCHLGIGSCGMHRINVAKGETSALKSREYTARGLPFVIAYEDRGFDNNFDFLLELEANDEPIDMLKIVDFYQEINKISDFNKKMNLYAKQNLTWESKLKIVAEEFQA